MKKTNLLFLLSASLLMAGCATNSNTSSASAVTSESSNSASSSETSTSQSSSSASESSNSASSSETSSSETSSSETSSSETSETESSSSEVIDEGYKVTFCCDEHASVYVYAGQDYTGEKTLATETYSLNKDDPTKKDSSGDGQVNFYVEVAEGYQVENIAVEGTYNNIKGEADTGVANVYRITKIGSDLTVTITTSEESEDPSDLAYKATFNYDSSKVSISTFNTNDFTLETTALTDNTAYSKDKSSGEYTKIVDNAQVNFKAECVEGYTITEVTVEGTYKNLKTPADTEADNVYSITKVGSDITVTVTVAEASAEEEGGEEEVDPATLAYTATFTYDSSKITVYTFDTNDYTTTKTALVNNTAYTKDKDNGEYTMTKKQAQINFYVECAEGYTYSVAVTSGTYKNLKDPTEDGTNTANVYSITQVESNLTIEITVTAAE